MTTSKNLAIEPVQSAAATSSRQPAFFRSRPGSGGRRLLAALLVLHGFAHLVGTADAIRAVQDDGLLEYAFGRWELTSTPALVAAGFVWTLIAAAFAVAAVATWKHTPRWVGGLGAVAATSFVLCLVALPETFIGLIVNGALLAAATKVARTQQGMPR